MTGLLTRSCITSSRGQRFVDRRVHPGVGGGNIHKEESKGSGNGVPGSKKRQSRFGA